MPAIAECCPLLARCNAAAHESDKSWRLYTTTCLTHAALITKRVAWSVITGSCS